MCLYIYTVYMQLAKTNLPTACQRGVDMYVHFISCLHFLCTSRYLCHTCLSYIEHAAWATVMCSKAANICSTMNYVNVYMFLLRAI